MTGSQKALALVASLAATGLAVAPALAATSSAHNAHTDRLATANPTVGKFAQNNAIRNSVNQGDRLSKSMFFQQASFPTHN